jgi:hypothetical protein
MYGDGGGEGCEVWLYLAIYQAGPGLGPGRGKPDAKKSGPSSARPSPARSNIHDTHRSVGPRARP